MSSFGRLLAAVVFGVVLLLVLLGRATGDDGLDLPVEKPAPVTSSTPPLGTVWTGVKVSGTGPVVVAPLGPLPPPVEPRDSERPPTFYGTELRESASVFFVLDFSGSMTTPAGTRLGIDGQPKEMTRRDQAIVETTRAVHSLPGSVRFDVMVYDCSTSRWRPGLEPATEPAKASAVAWLDELPITWGGTGTAPAVVDALRARPKLVVLLTDGDPNCPVAGDWGPGGTLLEQGWHRDQIKANNPDRARIDVFGIAATGSMRKFCTDVAGDNGGSYQDVK